MDYKQRGPGGTTSGHRITEGTTCGHRSIIEGTTCGHGGHGLRIDDVDSPDCPPSRVIPLSGGRGGHPTGGTTGGHVISLGTTCGHGVIGGTSIGHHITAGTTGGSRSRG